ncbi:sodium channel regulatory subunit beta-3 isoform X2 [Genypterus blacodes]|uniref:sodium channel regulatory subunit beta-3 isoform X2 n=1 Tax=Genypterus blacodes TaxID=154954 RepID=UPI003F7646B9
MHTRTRAQLQTLVLFGFVVHLSRPVCVDAPSDTNAVLGRPMKLTCISCLKREEVKANTQVDWYYVLKDPDGNTLNRTLILQYKDGKPQQKEGPWYGRLKWSGSQDLQDLSIRILNVTLNDSGTYECDLLRLFEFDFFEHPFRLTRVIELKVKEKASKESAAVYSEIMMYLLLVCLTLWLLVEMVYCYRKISNADEQAQDTAY